MVNAGRYRVSNSLPKIVAKRRPSNRPSCPMSPGLAFILSRRLLSFPAVNRFPRAFHWAFHWALASQPDAPPSGLVFPAVTLGEILVLHDC